MQFVACTSTVEREDAYVTQSAAYVHKTEPEAYSIRVTDEYTSYTS